MPVNESKGQLYIVSAPSGAGKTSLLKSLRLKEPDLKVSVSHTTRSPRPGEVDGVHYHFINESSFNEMVEQVAFVEHAKVFGNCYGTAASTLQAALDAGDELILEIDWQGASQVRALFPDAISIFILPPSIETLRQRLVDRGQDNAAVIKSRMEMVKSDISHYPEFDYIVFNDDFDEALGELVCIVNSQRLKTAAQIRRHQSRLAELTA